MHRAWLLPELALQIAEACAPNFQHTMDQTKGHATPGHRTLRNLALTCRQLQGCALDVIWYYQFGMSRLLRLLPDDLWMQERGSLEDSGSESDDEVPRNRSPNFMLLVSTGLAFVNAS